MPTVSGLSVRGKQLLVSYTITPTSVFIEMPGQVGQPITRKGYAALVVKRAANAPECELVGKSLWSEGLVLRPNGYPEAAGGKLVYVYWLFDGIAWTCTY